MKTLDFSGKIKKLAKWPRKLLLGICHWWIPSRLSPGSQWILFFSLSWRSEEICLKWPATFVNLSFMSILQTVLGDCHVPLVWWAASERCPPLPSPACIREGLFVIFVQSKSFLPPVKQHLIWDLSSPRTYFRNTSTLAWPHLNISVKTFSWTHFINCISHNLDFSQFLRVSTSFSLRMLVPA